MTSLRAASLVFVVSLAGYCFALGNAPLAGTEGHRGLTAHQMVQSGEWLLPRLYDQLYLKKPPLAYWIIALFETIAGRGNEWVWRLPSAVFSAGLAAALCLFANNWFGRPAGIVAGFSHLALVATWAQNRSADIDALNSTASVLAACGLIHLQVGPVRHRIWTILLTGIAIGASLLIKGPAGLTIIGGAIFSPWIAQRKWNPASLIPLLIGLGCFGIYALAAYHEIRAEHLPLDLSGLAEAEAKGTPTGSHILHALLLPFILAAYALPLTLVIPLVWKDSRPLVRAILATLAVALILAVASGMTNPRYAYVILPMLCPLAGAGASEHATRRYLPIAIAITVAAMIPFAILNNRSLTARSGYAAAQILAAHVPPGTTVITGRTIWDQPELFYYAHVNVNSDLAHATPGHWLVLKEEENDEWAARLKANNDTPILIWPDPGKNINLVWYGSTPH